MPPQFLTQGPVLLLEWTVPMPPAPLGDRSQRPTPSIGGGFAFDNPVPFARAPPVMGEAQQVEAPYRVARSSPLTGRPAGRPLEGDQPGLLRVERQALLAKPFGQDRLHPPGVFFLGKAQHEVIAIADQVGNALQPRLDLPLKPHFVSFAWRYPLRRLVLRFHRPKTSTPMDQEIFGCGAPHSRAFRGRR